MAEAPSIEAGAAAPAAHSIAKSRDKQVCNATLIYKTSSYEVYHPRHKHPLGNKFLQAANSPRRDGSIVFAAAAALVSSTAYNNHGNANVGYLATPFVLSRNNGTTSPPDLIDSMTAYATKRLHCKVINANDGTKLPHSFPSHVYRTTCTTSIEHADTHVGKDACTPFICLPDGIWKPPPAPDLLPGRKYLHDPLVSHPARSTLLPATLEEGDNTLHFLPTSAQSATSVAGPPCPVHHQQHSRHMALLQEGNTNPVPPVRSTLLPATLEEGDNTLHFLPTSAQCATSVAGPPCPVHHQQHSRHMALLQEGNTNPVPPDHVTHSVVVQLAAQGGAATWVIYLTVTYRTVAAPPPHEVAPPSPGAATAWSWSCPACTCGCTSTT